MKIFNRSRGKNRVAHLILGQRAEHRALQFLIENGMRHIHSNYRCRSGEIDLVMRDNDHIVFVEVRYRGSQRYGGALASIGPKKISRLRKTALHYLQRFDPAGKHPCRFDVVVPDSESDPGLTWIKNAF